MTHRYYVGSDNCAPLLILISVKAITTKGGKLVITLTQERFHDLNFRSGVSHV
jgi:hypothetical protein